MKTKIKLLLALSGMPFSCNHVTQATVLNIKTNNGKSAGQEKKITPSDKGCVRKNTNRNIKCTTSKIFNILLYTAMYDIVLQILSKDTAQMSKLIVQMSKLHGLIVNYEEDSKQHNAIDHRFSSDSWSTLYFERWRAHAEHHNKFFDYINLFHLFDTTSNSRPSWVSQIKSLLAFAVFSKSPKVVLEFIKFLKSKDIQVDINAKDLFGTSVLHYAIASGHKEMVKVLIEEAPLVHIHGKDKALDFPNLLDQAISFGKKEIVKVLINAGADPNRLYDSGRMLMHGNGLMLAAVYDQKDVARYLIENNLIKDLDQKGQCGQTILMRIAANEYPGWSKILDTLLEKRATIQAKDLDGRNILMHLLHRYRYMYNTYYRHLDVFMTIYNLDGKAQDMFQRLCKDKNEILISLCNHKDIRKNINNLDESGQNTLAYFERLITEIPNEKEKNEILKILMDSDLNDAAYTIDVYNYLSTR